MFQLQHSIAYTVQSIATGLNTCRFYSVYHSSGCGDQVQPVGTSPFSWMLDEYASEVKLLAPSAVKQNNYSPTNYAEKPRKDTWRLG